MVLIAFLDMAVSSAFAGAKLETLLLGNTSSTRSSPSQNGVFCKPTRTRRTLIQRGWASFNPTVRSEVASDVSLQTSDKIDTNTASSSSLFALEQLKTSAADQ
ncbi:glutamyl-tRNA reductase 1, chloroplastic-like isoform X2 [Cornus florida]|uniref:glutamyl-tRNA reductase 1, chloroplastic-like isoform X2 n=1 Tax=Cornus florida TaxID=4283 RepID=UPI0028A1F092|nr:glutamyl-tRNA reductase 1, chloroplastic-like isoform X2 [Cornus florida]